MKRAPVANLYRYPPPGAGSEQTSLLHEGQGIRIERICSNLARTGWYDQEEDEWVVLLEGEAEIAFETRTLSLQRGDTLFIPAHRRHRVVSTSENALWLAVHYSK